MSACAGEPAAPERTEPDGDAKPDYRISLVQAEQLALQYSRALRAALKDRDAAEGRIMSAYGEALPVVEAGFNKVFSDTYAEKRAGRERDRWNKRYQGSLSFRQPIFKGGRIGAGLRAARLYRENVDESIRQARQSLLYDVRTLYYAILLNERLVAVAKEQVDLAGNYLEDVRKRRTAEVATGYDVLRAEVERTNAETAYTAAHNDLVNAESAFLRLLGLPLTSELSLTDPLEYDPVPTASEVELYARAMAYRPEVRSSDLTIRMQAAQVRSTRAELLPHLHLQGETTGVNTDFDWEPREYDKSWTLMLNLTWTVFDGLLVRGQLKEQRATLEKLKIRDQDLADRVRLEIRQALLDIESARQTVESQQRNVDQARESLRLTEVRERQGVSTHLDVLNARTTLAVAQKNYYGAIHNYKLAWTDLALAIGSLGEDEAGLLPTNPQAMPEDADIPRTTTRAIIMGHDTD